MALGPLFGSLGPLGIMLKRGYDPASKGFYHFWALRASGASSNLHTNYDYTGTVVDGSQTNSVVAGFGQRPMKGNSSAGGGPTYSASGKSLNWSGGGKVLETDPAYDYEIFGADRTLCIHVTSLVQTGNLGEIMGGEFNRGQFFINGFSGPYAYNSNGSFAAVSGVNFSYPVFVTQLANGTVKVYSGQTPSLIQTITTAGSDIGGQRIRMGNWEAGFGSATMNVVAFAAKLVSGGMTVSDMVDLSIYLQSLPA